MSEESDYAAMIRFDVESHDTLKPRSLLTDTGHIGMSSLRCREEIRRTLAKMPASDSPPKWKAIIGTALDEQFETALREAHPTWWFKKGVTATLPSGTKISGTLDWADPDEPSVTDLKSKDTLAYARKHWADEVPYRFQRHLLGYALIQEYGWDAKKLIVRNLVVDRSGKEDHPFSWAEPFSMDVVREADDYLADVFYALDHGEEAPKDLAGHACRYCRFFTACRGTDVVTGPITVPALALKVDAYADADRQEKQAKAVKEALRMDVLNVDGRTERTRIYSSKVASNGSQRITVSEI